ncbi:neutral zinc metallopeptidase [Dactylosporangium sp. NPDC050688]|uniref:neutral zinc metallopeptidase n=1 Tax=Dactylosporangium sp. NPDC050688 TaxID=3157217 RepID=UPI00340A1BBC
MFKRLAIAGLVLTVLSGCDPDAGAVPPGGPGSTAATSPALTPPVDPAADQTAAPAGSRQPATFEADVQAALNTVVHYWQEEFAEHRRDFAAVRTITQYRGADGPRCGEERLPPNNAAYCAGPDYIAYDQQWLRGEWSSIGATFVYYVIGHEYGHAIQQRLGLTASFTIKAELQADCLAGAYLGGSIADGSLELEEGDLRQLFDGIGSVADRPGVHWFDTGAHGSATQRRIAFFGGYFGTTRACTTEL